MATHSSTLAWKIPRLENPGRLQSMGLQSQTWLRDFTSLHFKDKEDVVLYMYEILLHEILLSHWKRIKIIPFAATWIDLEIVIPSEVSQTKANMIILIGGILKKWYKWAYLQTRNRVIDVENKPMDTKGKGVINWKIGINIYTLLYIK